MSEAVSLKSWCLIRLFAIDLGECQKWLPVSFFYWFVLFKKTEKEEASFLTFFFFHFATFYLEY